MSTAYEFTFVYEVPFEECRAFLGSVLGGRSSEIHGVRRHGPERTAVTVVIETDLDAEDAAKLARQRVAGILPNLRPVEERTEV